MDVYLFDNLMSRVKRPIRSGVVRSSMKGEVKVTAHNRYIKAKAARSEIKSFEIYESHTGEEKKNNEENDDDCDERAEAGRGRTRSRGMAKVLVEKTIQLFSNLLQGLEHNGHYVTMDNFYNSPTLARYLKFRGFYYLGTVRLTRKNKPEDVKQMNKKCKKGTIIARHSGDAMVSFVEGC
ncbi:hypothetical protein EVAR_10366_1 [Eumeta japonica]|uniref:PiggyBac transposable element-derived protein domain-containing protein n=1 Tax=Eumeta variegata TaxID=151549 RepID=A0A4C1UCC6_EUMVA|nr:hypothetical protein EVAR_10366_1 [Eumeta japonica]